MGEVGPSEAEARRDDAAVNVRVVGGIVGDAHPVDTAGRDVVDRGRREQVARARHPPNVAGLAQGRKVPSRFFSRDGTHL